MKESFINRPKKRRKDSVREDTEQPGLTNWEEHVNDRESWWVFVAAAKAFNEPKEKEVYAYRLLL